MNLECKDCNKSLKDCTCIENTVNMKQETLEEARANSYIDFAKSNENVSAYSFVAGWDKSAKWQAERMYREEEVLEIVSNCDGSISQAKKWFEQFKKK